MAASEPGVVPVPGRLTRAKEDSGSKVPQPGKRTMLCRKRREPARVRYWSLISESMWAEVGAVDELGGGVVEGGLPGAELDRRRERTEVGEARGREVAFKEEAGEDLEAGEEWGQDVRVEEQELGFDALDAGGVLKHFKDVAGEGLGGDQGGGGRGRGEEVADDGFGVFVDAEGVTDDLAAVEGDEAGEDAVVEVLEEEVGGGAVIPAETALPGGGLLGEERAQLARVEVAEVEDFELWRGRGQGVSSGGRFTGHSSAYRMRWILHATWTFAHWRSAV